MMRLEIRAVSGLAGNPIRPSISPAKPALSSTLAITAIPP